MNKMSSTSFIGIDSRIERVESLLCIGSSDVSIVGIWGMGGIGKTTIAEAVFNRNFALFDNYHFFANVREESEKHGSLHFRSQLVSKICGKGHFNTRILNNGFTFRRRSHRKALIVLDDVNSSLQLQELLIEGRNLFGRGTKVIVTSRDRQVLKNGVDEIYEVEGLNHKEALQLFSINAFNQTHPFEEFMQLSKRVVYYANGNPLALKVLGCFLLNKRIQDWELALDTLKRTSNMDMKNVLRLSYDGLEIEEKDIFLDIACFFKGEHVCFVERILDGCGFFVDIGISNLVDKSLITISNDKLWMHDLIQEMGWEIVKQESTQEPGERSRLWHHEDIYHVLTKNTGTKTVEGITLDLSEGRGLNLTSEAFKKMYNLRLLKFHDSDFEDFCKVHFPDEGFSFHSNKLRYLHWYKYPSKSLPYNFSPVNLVELNLPRSSVEQLWQGVQCLVKLKRIDLSYSKHLIRIPDLSNAQNLGSMNLKGCTNLIQVPSSIQNLNMLEYLNLEGCRFLNSLPNMIALKFLRTLNIVGCSNIKTFPEIAGNVEELFLNQTAIEEVPSSIEFLTRLGSLYLTSCTKLQRLPSNICKLKCLQMLNLSGCSRLESFPEISETMEGLKYLYLANCRKLTSLPNSIGNLKSLQELDLKGTMIKELSQSIEHLTALHRLELEKCQNLVSLPDSICHLKSLKNLNFAGCSKLDKLPEYLHNIKSLEDLDISGTAIKHLPSSIIHLENIERLSFRVQDSAGIIQIPTELNNLSSLKTLILSGNNFESIPASVEYLSQLHFLDIGECKRLRYLPDLPQSLQSLLAPECISLEIILSSKHFCELDYEPGSRNCKYFAFTNCFRIEQKTHSSILEDIERRIQLVASVSDQLYNDGGSVKIHLPGNEIPIWFCNKSLGSSVCMLLHSSYSQLRGIALSVVLEFEDCYVDKGLIVRCQCHFKTKHTGHTDLTFSSNYCLEWYYKPIPFKSNHLFVWDDHCLEAKGIEEEDWFSKYGEASFEFYPLDYEENLLQDCKVKKCGIHLLFADPTDSRISGSAKEEEEPSPKRLKCSQDLPRGISTLS